MNGLSFCVIINYLLTAIEFSLGGSSPYSSTDKTINLRKRNSTKTQYKQYKNSNMTLLLQHIDYI